MIVSPIQVAPVGKSYGAAAPVAATVHDFVKLALLNGLPDRMGSERRRTKRHPFPNPVYLTPLTADEKPILDDTVAVIGRHLSLLGLDFFHRDPIPYRRAICSLPYGPESWVGLVMNLTWCRFNGSGWYDGGGHFVRTAESPLRRTRY